MLTLAYSALNTKGIASFFSHKRQIMGKNMDADLNKPFFETLMTAITLVGLLGTTAGGFIAWLEKRNIKAKYQDEINLAERRIAFLTNWFKAQEPVCTPQRLEQIKLETSQELDSLRSRLSQFILESEQHSVFSKGKSYQKTFLLFIPHNIGGWLSLIFFYVLLIFVLLFITIPPEGNDLKSWAGWFTDSVMWLFIFAIPLFFLQRLGIRFSRKKG